MWRVDGDVVADEGNTGSAFFDFFDGGVVAVDEDDGDVAAVNGRLFFHNNDVTIFQCRKHRITAYLQGKEISCSCHFRCDFFIVQDFFNSFDRNAGDDAAEDGDADAMACWCLG